MKHQIVLIFLILVSALWFIGSQTSSLNKETDTSSGELALVEPARIISGWRTVSTKFYAFQHPAAWNNKMNQYQDSDFRSFTQDNVCPVIPGEISGSVSFEPSQKAEKDFYNLESWGGSEDINYNGGEGHISRQIIQLGNKKAIEEKILWVSGTECNFKPRVDQRFNIYTTIEYPYISQNEKNLQIDLRYFPDELDNKAIIDQIISTFKFADNL